MPSAIAGELSKLSPPSYVHLSVSAAGTSASATPVSCALPRNCGHASSGCTADGCDTKATKNTQITRNTNLLLVISVTCVIVVPRRRLVAVSLPIDGEREQLVAVVHEEASVRGDERGVHGAPHVLLGQHLLGLARREHGDVAVLVADVDMPVDHHRRSPDGGEHVVRPEHLAGLRVEAMHEAAEIGD